MISWLVSPAAAVAGPVDRLARTLVDDGLEPPEWMVADDLEDAWLAELAACPPRRRRHGVIAVRDPRSAAAAIRFGVGGALWLPASAGTLRTAWEAAASSPDPPDRADPEAAAALVEGARQPPTVAARLRRAELWRRQWGSVRLLRWMHSIRDALGVPSAVLPGPGLVVTGRSLNEVRDAAETTCHAIAPPPCPELEVRTWRRGSAAEAVAWAATAGDGDESASDGTAPVHELPSGEVVGRWGVSESATVDEPRGEWIAFPSSLRPDGHRWRLRSPSGHVATVDDAVEPEVFETATVAVRVPGWVTADVRPGSPAGILIERMARQALRSETALWIPGVAQDALLLVLRTGARVWVDGPATPRTAD